jgi:DNA-binding NarL/FixJ family response regulator
MRGTLSSRERTIVEDVANGGAHKVVAADHGISVQAVSTYLARARRKLGVTSRADLIQAVLWNDDRATARCRGDVATQVVLNGEHFRLIRRPIGALGGFTQGLTSAERDILSGILQGLKNTEIARMRATSVRTVAAQVSVLMRKLGAMSRAELVAVVLRA